MSSEGRNYVLLWYLLVGVLVGLSTGASGCWGWAQVVRPVLSAASTNVDKWLGRGTGVTAPTYPGPGNCHVLEAGTWVGGEQARPVKTVKVRCRSFIEVINEVSLRVRPSVPAGGNSGMA